MNSIKINGKEYDLHFGIDFIREMDKRYNIDANGFPFGAGLQSAIVYLSQSSPVIVADIILSATHTLKQIPSMADIETWIGEQEDLEKVCDDFLSALQNAPMTKAQVNKIIQAMEQAQAE